MKPKIKYYEFVDGTGESDPEYKIYKIENGKMLFYRVNDKHKLKKWILSHQYGIDEKGEIKCLRYPTDIGFLHPISEEEVFLKFL